MGCSACVEYPTMYIIQGCSLLLMRRTVPWRGLVSLDTRRSALQDVIFDKEKSPEMPEVFYTSYCTLFRRLHFNELPLKCPADRRTKLTLHSDGLCLRGYWGIIIEILDEIAFTGRVYLVMGIDVALFIDCYL
jgi:hypothetical protein